MKILKGECRRIESLEARVVEFQADDWVRLKGARALSPEARQAARELAILRDELACEQDVPLFRVMNNQTLLTVAAERPRSHQQLTDIHGISWRQTRKIGDRVLDALQRAADLGPLKDLPSVPSKSSTAGLDPYQVVLHERLSAWRRDRSQSEGIDASLVLNRHTLVRLVKGLPRTSEDLAGTEGLVVWQVEQFGQELLEVLRAYACDRAAGRIEVGRRSPRSQRRR
jgi:ribonuclease D